MMKYEKLPRRKEDRLEEKISPVIHKKIEKMEKSKMKKKKKDCPYGK
ncbi:MAG TPA: hypothetical protein VHA52_02375 [Candidatus Babeliaceae bacterium]|nr:hypothetical protein [Candidatus Babeliaceae bacterium]